MYGTEVSPTLISSVTDAVMDEAKAWQARPLDVLYPIVYLDCIHVKTRDTGVVRAKAVYLALGINMAGEKEILGLWIAQTEGAKFWLQVVTELKNRGVADIFIACVDGLKGFPEAIEAVYPQTAVQLCLVHMVRHSLNYVSWKMRKVVAADLKTIYSSATADEAVLRLQEFEEKWGAEQHQQEVDDAPERLESRINPVYPSVRRQDAQGLIAATFTQNAVHPTDWRAVCGRTARTVRREERTRVLLYPYRNLSSDDRPRAA